MALTQVPPALLTATTGTGTTVALSASPTFTGTVTTPSVTFSDASTQTAAASPYVLKNRIINGAMVIDQRNAGASVSISSGGTGYSADRWFYEYSGSATGVTIQQVTDAPTGFSNSIKLTGGTGASVGATNYLDIEQKIEGFNWYDMAFGTASAKTVTLSFWVKSSIAGTYGICLQNAASSATRCYATSYTISSANTWEQKTITITGDTSGTWVGASNACALNILFAAGIGSTYQTSTINSWQSNGFLFPNTITNTIISTSGATLQFTGVQLEIGSTATPFERRLYNQELANCQRYYQTLPFDSGFISVGATLNTNSVRGPLFQLNVNMRAAPTVTLPTAGSGSGQLHYTTSSGAVPGTIGTNSVLGVQVNSFRVEGDGYTSAFTAGQTSLLRIGPSSGASITASAEL